MAAKRGGKVSPKALLVDVSTAIDRCNRCGFCQAGCPTYKVTGVEWMTARGRIALVRGVLEGKLDLDDADLAEPLWTCLGCDGCTMHCPPGIKTDEIVDAAREALVVANGEPLVQRLILRSILPRSGLLSASTRAMRVAQRAGLMPAGAKLGRVLLGGQLDQAWDVLPPLPGRTARDAIGRPEALANRKCRVAYFLGCATNLLFPDVGVATVRVLRRNHVDVVLPPNVCCGKPAAAYGDRAAALNLARRNVDLLADLDVDFVIVDCPTCGTFLGKYPTLLGDDPERAERAAALARKVKDISAFLVEMDAVAVDGGFRGRVTYHDPCHLAHFQAIATQPRRLLRGVSGVDFREAAEADLCCGGAGTFALRERELSLRILDRKIDSFARTDAEALVTACPSCLLQLSYGVRRRGLAMRVLHTVQVLDHGYGGTDAR